MSGSVGRDFTSWSGWDLREGRNAEPHATQEFERTAKTFPSAEVRYALLAVAGRGFRPPGYLVSVDYKRDVGTESQGDPTYPGLRQTWSTRYRQIAETSPPTREQFAVYLLGVNPPADVSDESLDDFNDFYTDVHLVEVAERRHALRAVRYELVEEVRPPYQGAPKYLAAYEVDESSASQRRHTGPPYSVGPEVWQRHTTPWRLWYRRLGV